MLGMGSGTACSSIGAVRGAREGTVQTEEQAEFVRQYEDNSAWRRVDLLRNAARTARKDRTGRRALNLGFLRG